MKIYYDLHIHTCLSPCGHEDMTPNNIVGMSQIKGLNIIAITDHNTTSNCEAAIKAAEGTGLVVIPGMELETLEGVHLVCLFPDLKLAKSFQRVVDLHRLPVRNRVERFGEQLILNENDEVIGSESTSLMASTFLDIDTAIEQVHELGGLAYPAHIDRPSYSVISNLGFIPPFWDITTVEISKYQTAEGYENDPQYTEKYHILRNSDAHDLVRISEQEQYLELETCSARALFAYLKKRK